MLIGYELLNELRNSCENVKNNIWICVPFIGSWNNIQQIMGTSWINKNIDFRLLIDVRNEGYINRFSIKNFQRKGLIKSLPGLHAKIYIIDDKAIVTSANLTGTAFSKRYEIGYSIKASYVKEIFEKWWKISDDLENGWLPKNDLDKTGEKEEGETRTLKTLWKLPPLKNKMILKKFNNYYSKIKKYEDFKNMYITIVDRVWPNLPLNHEIDSFLNYLFHEHPNKPSKTFYYENQPRNCDNLRRSKDIIKFHKQYRKWLEDTKWDTEEFRLNRIHKVQEILSEKNIKSINKSDIEQVISNIHCLESMAINKSRFLNEENNKINVIVDNWNILLHDKNNSIAKRIEICNDNLKYFGYSAIQELISNYYPNKYPIINGNSDSGLRFFGYEV